MPSDSVADLIGQQVRRWELEARDKKKRSRPCIAIARLPFSGATELGQKLADRLGYGFFGREIVDEIAKEEGIRRDLVAGIDEHNESAIERHILDGFRHRGFNESDYVRDVVRIVTTLGIRGATVLLGRGAARILTPEQALRVLVVAPLEWRRERLARLRALGAKEAAERLQHADQERSGFWQRSFQIDYLAADAYDLVVNPATLTIDGAVQLVAEAFCIRFPSAA
jgi:cytidylate kinase